MKCAGELQSSSNMASKQIEFHKEAAAEYEAALDWYFERSHLAAQKFADEISQAIESIAQSPQRWPTYLPSTRRFFLRRFPFTVIYRELHSTIQILAVAHGHRRPGYWKKKALKIFYALTLFAAIPASTPFFMAAKNAGSSFSNESVAVANSPSRLISPCAASFCASSNIFSRVKFTYWQS